MKLPGTSALTLMLVILHVLYTVDKAGAWQMKRAPLMTQWAALVDTNSPLPEYPRPQLVRSNWLNLNGVWQFQPAGSGDSVPFGQTLTNQILVPYPMESAISGVMQYHQYSWYRRTFTVPGTWSGQHVILHLDAVDWQATVYVNGVQVGLHKGGYDPFSYDITPYLNGGANELIINVYSPEDSGSEPRGKQSLYPGGIMYTSSSGIWQPVWLEPVDASGVNNLQVTPDLDNSQLRLTINTYATNGVTVVATVSSNGVVVNNATGNPQTELDIPVENPNLWTPEKPFLYDLRVSTIHNGITNDSVTSYFGMRKISVSTVNGISQIFLNNKPYFEMGPLDQGFWPDGIYTAPTDAALKFDLQEEKALGFNMVRKHIKVERQRWYYWADKLGLLVWQDMPSGNSYTGNPNPPAVDPIQFIAELTCMVTNHWNSPCIIMWDVFNEGQGEVGSGNGVGQTNTAYLVQLVKTLDPSRLVNQASGGNYFGVGDVFDEHSYPPPGDPSTATQVPVDGEYGGIGFLIQDHLWNPAQAGGAYTGVNNISDLASLYDTWCDNLVYYKGASGLNAAVYTQITDVENECNGLMTYDRILKPDPSRISVSNQKAITGQYAVTTVMPTSQTIPQTWQYTTNIPATNWFAVDFNASGWNTGLAGFGTTDPNVTPNTTWNTPGYIYLRRTFYPGALTAQQISNLVFTVYHDEDVVIYINGVLAGSASGYSTAYVPVTMTPQGQAAIIPNGTNVLAVSCRQTIGGQFIDVGIAEQILVADTLADPVDYFAYWPLDATNGSVAVDASGGGNNGMVNGATWNANGQINGCLNFNGINNFVQVSNVLGGDFSVAFWVKATQSGGSGQWWQGLGLVDGFAAAVTNDFGMALTGNQFAFGTGNPDTTIISTTPINDGVWHHCVATRQQSTGALAIYVDGALQATGTGGTNLLNASAYLRFGALQTGAGFFNGSLDEIRFFNRVLGGSEVAALYENCASPPVAPTNLTASVASGQVTLNWFESLPAASYTVSRSTTRGGPYTVIGTTTSTSYTDTDVVNGITYFYVVAGIDLAGLGGNSTEVSATPYNLALWLKADAIIGMTNGSNVSVWDDASGNGFNATQAIAGQQPAFVTGAMNGLPVVRFNSGYSNYLAFDRPVKDDFTMFVVYQSRQNNQGTGTAFFQGSGLVNGDEPGAQNDFGIALNANGQVVVGTGNPDTSITSDYGFNDGKPHLVAFKRIKNAGSLALDIDGMPVATRTAGSQSLTAPLQLWLGAVPSGGGFLSGDIAEVKIYNSTFSDAERLSQEASLIQKWGISLPAAPSGLSALPANGQVLLNWNGYPMATNYWVMRSTTNGGPYTIIGSTTLTNYLDAAVGNGTTYYYVISAVTPIFTSASSSQVSAIPVPPAVTAWFRADTLAGLTNGAAIANWPDTTGNGFTATQTNAVEHPVYVTNAMNGLPVVRFNSANSTYLAFNRPVQDDFTILIMCQSIQNDQGTGTIFYQGAGLVNGDQPFVQNDFGLALNANGQIMAGTGNPDVSIDSSNGFNNGQPHLVTFKRAKSTGEFALYVDQSLAATGIGGTNSLTTPAELDMGAMPSGGGFLTGDIAEVKIFNSALSDPDRMAEENALACKYGLAGSNIGMIPPTGLHGTPGNHRIVLNWLGASGAAAYDLWSATGLGGPFQIVGANLTANGYIDTNAVSGRTNYYEIASVNGCNVSPNSAIVGIYLPLPALAVAAASSHVITIGWPVWANDWKLYFATNLVPPVTWFADTHTAISNNGLLTVTIPVASEKQFFRLNAP